MHAPDPRDPTRLTDGDPPRLRHLSPVTTDTHDQGEDDAEPDPAEAARNEQIESLLQAMEELPSHPTVALRVLWLVDDP